MKEKLKLYLDLAKYILKENFPLLIIIGLLSIQFICFIATYYRWNTFVPIQGTLIYSPWVIFLMSYCLNNNKYHIFWHNSKNIELILKTYGIDEKYNPKILTKKYKTFLSYEDRDNSDVAKYFLDDKVKSNKNKYKDVTTSYPLTLFVKEFILLSICRDVFYGKYNATDLLKFAQLRYGEETIRCRYKLLYEDSSFYDCDIEEVFCNYIAFSVFNKADKISFENMILFGIDYFKYNYDNRSKKTFEKYYKEKIQHLEFDKTYTTGDYSKFMYYRPWCD